VGRGKPRTEIPSTPGNFGTRSLRSVLVTAGRSISETGFVQVGRHPGRITCKPEVSGSAMRRIGKLPY